MISLFFFAERDKGQWTHFLNPIMYEEEGWEIRINIVGGGGVGKTSFATYFISRFFYPEYDPNVEDTYRRRFMLDDENIVVELLDSAGMEFMAMEEYNMKIADGFILVYSVTHQESLQKLRYFVEKIQKVKECEFIPMLVVGNKSDVESERAVTIKEGFQFAATHNCPFFEASVKYGVNIDDPVHTLVREVIKFKTAAGHYRKEKTIMKKQKSCVVC